jgi:hypothetical protein
MKLLILQFPPISRHIIPHGITTQNNKRHVSELYGIRFGVQQPPCQSRHMALLLITLKLFLCLTN